ncbi:MAG: stage 0 sporulation family protein [Calditrichia bacterium]
MTQDFILVAFKGNRKDIYINPNEINCNIGDYVVVEADKGIDLGKVEQVGRLVIMKFKSDNPKKIIRKASQEELDKLWQNREKEISAFFICRQKIKKHNLNMKLVDVEFQFDQKKVTFYFTSDRRVDFRELVKDLAAKYKTRIEMRQIGVRDEARRVGGVGVCGRELCCASHLSSFAPITTQHAKDQMLPMNPSKLAGNCGRLKCCFNFERDMYLAELEQYPDLEQEVQTPSGKGKVIKIDIFAKSVTVLFHDNDYSDHIENFDSSEIIFDPNEKVANCNGCVKQEPTVNIS